MTTIDQSKIDEFRSLPTTEGKQKLADYALAEFGVTLLRTKSFDNMLKDLESAIVVETPPVQPRGGSEFCDEPVEDITTAQTISTYTIDNKDYGFYSLQFKAYDEMVKLFKEHGADWSTNLDDIDDEDSKAIVKAIVNQLDNVEFIEIQDTRNGYLTRITKTTMTVNSLFGL